MYVDLLDAAMFNATALSDGGFFAQCLQLLLDVEGLLAQAQQLSVHAAADLERVHETRDDFFAMLGRARAHVKLDSINDQIDEAIYDKVRAQEADMVETGRCHWL